MLYNGRALSDERKQSVTDSLTECISAEYLEQLTSYDGESTLICTNTGLQSLRLNDDSRCQLANIAELNAGYNRIKQMTIPQIDSLLSLDLQKNCIVDAFPLVKHDSLQELNLSNNPI